MQWSKNIFRLLDSRVKTGELKQLLHNAPPQILGMKYLKLECDKILQTSTRYQVTKSYLVLRSIWYSFIWPWCICRGMPSLGSINYESMSHPTVGVTLFGSNVSERLSSLREELPISLIILLLLQWFLE